MAGGGGSRQETGGSRQQAAGQLRQLCELRNDGNPVACTRSHRRSALIAFAFAWPINLHDNRIN